MDRTKANNHREIICGTSFDANEVLQELSRLRHQPIELILNKQEDAHELLCQLLNEIHDEICSVLYPTSNNKNGKSKEKEKRTISLRNILSFSSI